MKESRELRSRIMRAVKGRDTMPELKVRRLIHRIGYKFRLHRNDLPGSPDIVFPRLRKVVLVHGCFWHGHRCARGARIPKRNRPYWQTKITRNRARDLRNLRALRALGWRALIIWECNISKSSSIERRLAQFLEERKTPRTK